MTTIHFPSGLVADLRKIKGSEMAALAEQADGGGRADPFSTLLSSCWLQTIDPGPYAFVLPGDAKPEMRRLLKGDLLYGFVALRRISLPEGDTYDFDAQCERCRARIPWSVDLREIPVRVLSKESVERVRGGRVFLTSVDDDDGAREVRFNLQFLAQEDEMTRFMKSQKRTKATLLDTLASQIVAIDGVGPDFRARYRYLNDLSMGALLTLQQAFEEADCGLDTAIDVRCVNSDCRWEQSIALPFDKRFFALRKRPAKPTPAALDASSEASGEPSHSAGGETSALPSGGPSTAGPGSAG
jgi:hypothetical protein